MDIYNPLQKFDDKLLEEFEDNVVEQIESIKNEK